MKKKLIENIKKLIAEIGSTSTAEMQSESSQLYKNMFTHHSCCLIESYNAENITVVEYVHEQEVSQFYAPYEDMTSSQLKTVLFELKNYAEANPIN
jgi:hypothetical protein